MEPDTSFVNGELKYLVIGNFCRLLDKRRTPGKIIGIDMDGGFFRWEILDFEDKGKFWDVTFERVSTYQFIKESKELAIDQISELEKRISEVNQRIEISASSTVTRNTDQQLKEIVKSISRWLDAHSDFLRSNQKIDFQNRIGPELLRSDFNNFIKAHGFTEIEHRTAEIQVMNPNSGDWIKGIQIVMAEMGLKSYRGTKTRSSNAFNDLGSKENRKQYILHRMSFFKALFSKVGITEIELFRGMSTEWDWKPDTNTQCRFWSSWTFNHKVAQDFSELTPGSKHKNSYLIKRAIPVEKIFMTFLETDALNKQYLEAEAIILHGDEDRMLW